MLGHGTVEGISVIDVQLNGFGQLGKAVAQRLGKLVLTRTNGDLGVHVLATELC